MTDPRSNGHAPEGMPGNQPQPSQQAAFEAKNARIRALREEIAKMREVHEEQVDYVNAMYMTSEGALQGLVQENQRLTAENEGLKAQLSGGVPGEEVTAEVEE